MNIIIITALKCIHMKAENEQNVSNDYLLVK